MFRALVDLQKVKRSGYPSDVSDEEWEFIAPYLALVQENSLQRFNDLREVFRGVQQPALSGTNWRAMTVAAKRITGAKWYKNRRCVGCGHLPHTRQGCKILRCLRAQNTLQCRIRQWTSQRVFEKM
jgi:hypothetical protein